MMKMFERVLEPLGKMADELLENLEKARREIEAKELHELQKSLESSHSCCECKSMCPKAVTITITDTDVFGHVLAMIRVIYRNTKDEALKSFIKAELRRASGKSEGVDSVLESCERFDKLTENLNRR